KPRLVEQEARRRKRRMRLTRDGKLVLVALDHPARGITAIRGDALAMGDRFELLSRARRVLEDRDLDGVLASPDVMEELLLLNYLERRRGGAGFLDGRVLVGSMNRGGIAGTSFEMEDAFTGFSARRLAQLRCDGGKMLWRLDTQDPAAGRTMLACAAAMNELRLCRLPVFLEPLGVAKRDGRYEVQRDAATLVRQCGIAAGMGESSQNVWLKLPCGEDFARVGRSTTLPILLLGGPAREDPAGMVSDFAAGLSASTRVRGAVIGRNLLFPGDQDPLLMSRALTALVHRGARLKEAIAVMSSRKG
ncbi:MAG: Cgl0159 family (beta/alpha)8-fold protein, partial [Terriglobia bacterium]